MQPVPAHQSAMAKATAERNVVRAPRLRFIGGILRRGPQLVEQIQCTGFECDVDHMRANLVSSRGAARIARHIPDIQ